MSQAQAEAALEGARVAAFAGDILKPSHIAEVNGAHALVAIGSKAFVIRQNSPEVPPADRVQFLGIDAFRHLMGKHQFLVGDKWKSLADIWLTHPDRRDYQGIRFVPRPEEGEVSDDWFNLWQGFEVEPDPSGDCTLLLRHIEEIVCRGDAATYEWVMAWFASIFQKPRERYGTSLTLRGEMGAGKSLPGEIIGSLIAPHYFQVDDPRFITGQFNSHLKACLLLQAEEAFWAGDKQAEGRLKGMVTSSRQMIEHKGVDPITMDNYVRLLVTSNEDWVVPAGLRERRFAVLDVSPEVVGNREHFSEIHREMAKPGAKEALLYEMLNFPLQAIAMRVIPLTDALLDQKLDSADATTQWWNECLEHGEIEPGHEWPMWMATRKLHGLYRSRCDKYHVRRPADERSFMKKLKALCPGLKRKRRGWEMPEEEDEGIDSENPAGTSSPPRRTRPWGYTIPDLPEARAALEAAVGQAIEWDHEDPEDDDAGQAAGQSP
ncbi:MAG: primase-helicase family protein [Pseudomonadota bacterium]